MGFFLIFKVQSQLKAGSSRSFQESQTATSGNKGSNKERGATWRVALINCLCSRVVKSFWHPFTIKYSVIRFLNGMASLNPVMSMQVWAFVYWFEKHRKKPGLVACCETGMWEMWFHSLHDHNTCFGLIRVSIKNSQVEKKKKSCGAAESLQKCQIQSKKKKRRLKYWFCFLPYVDPLKDFHGPQGKKRQ